MRGEVVKERIKDPVREGVTSHSLTLSIYKGKKEECVKPHHHKPNAQKPTKAPLFFALSTPKLQPYPAVESKFALCFRCSPATTTAIAASHLSSPPPPGTPAVHHRLKPPIRIPLRIPNSH
ncbi:hypothetical protein PIB30_037071 [Stylosanthes scabra]|uniref:Uncharacterized protein n=1 Tax=Stylosanthes scabra TaxID=79078 RepID=A0ABU6WDK2_9FABA|nr:hypothetical protein [Stylosanthes scabra]